MNGLSHFDSSVQTWLSVAGRRNDATNDSWPLGRRNDTAAVSGTAVTRHELAVVSEQVGF
jgi:hypothetical protein